MKKWPRGSLHLRFSDNHDERRAIARFGEPAALAASALDVYARWRAAAV